MSKRLLTILAVVGFWATAAAAQPMGRPHMMKGFGPGGPGGPGMMGDDSGLMLPLVLKHANLTPEQSDQVHKIMEADHDALRALFKQLQTANDLLAAKLFAPGKLQEADLQPQVQQIMQLRRQLMEQGLKTALAIRAVLTPEQLTKVAQLKDRIEKVQAEMRSLFEGND